MSAYQARALLRRFGLALWLSLALIASQHAALLHDLGHATESLAQKHDGKPPAPAKCEKHSAFVHYAGTPGAGVSIPAVDCATADFFHVDSSAPTALALAYRSQAPPRFLA